MAAVKAGPWVDVTAGSMAAPMARSWGSLDWMSAVLWAVATDSSPAALKAGPSVDVTAGPMAAPMARSWGSLDWMWAAQ